MSLREIAEIGMSPESFSPILAIFLQLLATSLNYIGMTVQKKAAANLPGIGSEMGLLTSIKTFVSNRGWIFGYFLNASSTFLNAAALALAALSLIQPLYGFGLIVLVIFSHFYLKEEITKMDLIGIFLGIIGIVLIGLITKPYTGFSYPALINLYVGLPGILFLGIVLTIAILSYVLSEHCPNQLAIVFLVLSSSIWTAIAFLFSKAIGTIVRDLGFVGAFFGSNCYYTYIFLALFLFVSIIGILLLNVAYQRGNSVIIGPIWTSVQLILPVLYGIIVFNEWAQLSLKEILLQVSGSLVMLFSILLLSISNGLKEDQLQNHKQLENTSEIENDKDKSILDSNNNKG
ncbi:MAG: hypothetical protein GF308_12265 [Candidatus Heimdallarchaeota archaeon]|nr:hypothetical protein [Candidatus Heimdallarchaeota archaeon]